MKEGINKSNWRTTYSSHVIKCCNLRTFNISIDFIVKSQGILLLLLRIHIYFDNHYCFRLLRIPEKYMKRLVTRNRELIARYKIRASAIQYTLNCCVMNFEPI